MPLMAYAAQWLYLAAVFDKYFLNELMDSQINFYIFIRILLVYVKKFDFNL